MKSLILAAALGLAASQAGACDFQRSASSVDTTTVASISPVENMSIPTAQPPTVVVQDGKTVPAETK